MSSNASPPRKSSYDKLLDAICRVSIAIAGVALVVLTVIFGWLVFGRYVLNSTPTWVEQVALLLVMLIAFVGASVGIHRNTHLSISYFRDKSPPLVRRAFVMATHLVLAAFGIVMAVKGYELVLFKWGNDIPLLHVPEGLRAIPIMVCGGFVFLFSLGHLIRLFKAGSDDGED